MYCVGFILTLYCCIQKLTHCSILRLRKVSGSPMISDGSARRRPSKADDTSAQLSRFLIKPVHRRYDLLACHNGSLGDPSLGRQITRPVLEVMTRPGASMNNRERVELYHPSSLKEVGCGRMARRTAAFMEWID